MNTLQRKLLIEQVDKKMRTLAILRDFETPSIGWIGTIRAALNMSLSQLAKRLNKTPVTVKEIEQREESKGITLRKMMEVAEALECHFVYGFIPKNGTLESMIEQKSLSVAKDIVSRTSHTMQLEDQGISGERLKKAITERAEIIKNEIPRYLWD